MRTNRIPSYEKTREADGGCIRIMRPVDMDAAGGDKGDDIYCGAEGVGNKESVLVGRRAAANDNG